MTLEEHRKKMVDRIQFSAWVPDVLFRHCETVPKFINTLLVLMGICNFFLLLSVLQTTSLPPLGLSPIFLSFLLSAQNAMTWFALNNHRLSSLPTLVANDFVLGCLLGISIGGSIVAFVLSQFSGKLSNCQHIQMVYSDYDCNHSVKVHMMYIWFWSGLVFWFNTFLSVLIVFAKDELGYLQHTSQYENIGLALEELQSNFERTAVVSSNWSQQAPGDGTFFGSHGDHESLGEAHFLTTPSQEHHARRLHVGGYGVQTGFDDTSTSSHDVSQQQTTAEAEKEKKPPAKEIFV